MDSKQSKAAEEIKACASRLGRTPTQQDFDADPENSLKARTLAGYFPGGWREAVGAAGLSSGRSDEEMLAGLAELSRKLDRMPTSRDINDSPSLPSAALYLRRFGSIKEARRKAGIKDKDTESAEQMVEAGVRLSGELGRLPTWSDWEEACKVDPSLPSQWQVYRRFGGGDGAWRMFHYCLLEAGAQA